MSVQSADITMRKMIVVPPLSVMALIVHLSHVKNKNSSAGADSGATFLP